MRLVLASRNSNKLVELRALCGLPADFLVSAAECPGAPDPEEDADTFVGNALIKARALRDFSGEWALADDSGLEVDALGGAPGVHSARYAGVHGEDGANNALLLRNLDALGPKARAPATSPARSPSSRPTAASSSRSASAPARSCARAAAPTASATTPSSSPTAGTRPSPSFRAR